MARYQGESATKLSPGNFTHSTGTASLQVSSGVRTLQPRKVGTDGNEDHNARRSKGDLSNRIGMADAPYLTFRPFVYIGFNFFFATRKRFMMRFIAQERTALFIDGANLYAATRSLGFDIDYRRLLDYFGSKTEFGARLLLLRLAGNRGILAFKAINRLARL